MPEPPSSSLITRYVLENPWPIVAVCGVAGLILLWLGLREGRARQMASGLIVVLVGLATAVVGLLVVTAGEHARRVTAEFVDAVVADDLVTAEGLLGPDAKLALGSPTNPSYSREFLVTSLDRTSKYQITSNSKSMDTFTRDDDEGVTHLRCWTDVNGAAYVTPSNWVIEVERDSTGDWLIERITFVSIAGSKPDTRWW